MFGIIEVLGFPQKYHPNTNLTFPLQQLCSIGKAYQKCVQINPKPFQQVSMKF